jgi:hypothetical protein
MALEDLGAVVVEAAGLAEAESLRLAVENGLLVLAAGAAVLCGIELPLLANGKVGLVLDDILIMRPEEEVVLEGVPVVLVVDEDGV